MKRFSKLKARVESFFDPRLKLRLYCTKVRMVSQYGNTDLPRYYLKMGKKIVWELNKSEYYPYDEKTSLVSDLLRTWIDTKPKDFINVKRDIELISLFEILSCADKRVGQRTLKKFKDIYFSEPAKKIIEKRIS